MGGGGWFSCVVREKERNPESTICPFRARKWPFQAPQAQGFKGKMASFRVAPVRFGYGLGMERFERFRFSVPAVPLRRGFLCVSVQSNTEDGSGSGFGVPGKRFRRFRFHVRFLGKRFRRFRFPVPVRFLGHPAILKQKNSKTGEKTPKGQMVPISRACTGWG